MFLNPNIYKLLIEKQELDTFLENNTLVPKYVEERISLQDKSKYVEEFKNIIIVEKGTRTLEENNDESSDDEIVEIPESLKEQIQEEIKEQEDTIKEITIDDEALNLIRKKLLLKKIKLMTMFL